MTGSTRRVNLHVLACARYLQLYADTPAHCLEPAAEYRRHRAEAATATARAARRDTALTRRFAQLDRQQALAARRRPADILADD